MRMDFGPEMPLLCDANLNLIEHIYLHNIHRKLEQCPAYPAQPFNTEQASQFVHNFIAELLEFYRQNSDAVVRWNVHLIAKSFRGIVNRLPVELEPECWARFNRLNDPTLSDFYLIVENSDRQSVPLTGADIESIYSNLQNIVSNEETQSLLTKLKNSFVNDSVRTSFIIDSLSRKYNSLLGFDSSFVNIFDKIYLQSLIHALKNANQALIIEILLRSNASILTDQKLNQQIISHLVQNSRHQDSINELYLDLYTKCLFTDSSKLLEIIYEYKRHNDDEQLFTPDGESIFNRRKCFLYAVNERRHFLNEFYETYFHNRAKLSDRLPLKFRIILDILYMQRSFQHSSNDSAFLEKLFQFESELSKLFLEYESTVQSSESDVIFADLIEKFRFVFRFANWSQRNLNANKNDRNYFCYNVISSLLNGNSPLKILATHSYLELQTSRVNLEFYKENVLCDELSCLIEKYDNNESMTFKAFLALRLILFSFFSNDEHDMFVDVNQIEKLLQDIKPIQFRIEILENIFQLLFLSRKDLIPVTAKDRFSDDDEAWNETLTPRKDGRQDTSESEQRPKRKSTVSEGQKNLFLCPNWIIAHLLKTLKQILYKTSSELYDSILEQNSVEFECNKFRLNQLMKYVADAQFRHDVIRPAFYKTLRPVSRQDEPETVSTEYRSGEEYSAVDSEMNRETVSTMGSDAEARKGRASDWRTSLISCMLASKSQLLCYTLVENSLENALKIVQLFEDDLKDSKELRELKLVEHKAALSERVTEIYLSNFITGNRVENNSDEFKNSVVQSLIVQVLLEMEPIHNRTKKRFILDFGLSSSPSLEITQAIFDSVGADNLSLNFDDPPEIQAFSAKIDRFIVRLQNTISELAGHVPLAQLSLSDFVLKSIDYSNGLDAKTVVESVAHELSMIKFYREFQQITERLENRIVDDPTQFGSENEADDVQRDTEQLLSVFRQIADLCKAGPNYYLQTLLLYVCKVSKALRECKKRNLEMNKSQCQPEFSSLFNSASYFSILRQSPSAILCSMVIKSKISPKIIDDLAMNMKVNLMAVLCSVYCPAISTTDVRDNEQRFAISELVHPCLYEIVDLYQKGIEHCDNQSITSTFVANFFAEEVDENFEKSFEKTFQPLINQEVLNYFNAKCPILVELLQITGLVGDSQLRDLTLVPGTKLHIFDDSPLLRWIELVKSNFFYGDSIATVSLSLFPRILSSNTNVLRSLEHFAVCQNYSQIYNMFKFINGPCPAPENMSSSWDMVGKTYEMLKNAVFCRLALMQEDARFIFHIVNEPKVKCELVHYLVLTSDRYNDTFMATRLVRLALQSILDDQTQVPVDVSEYERKLEMLLSQIEFYSAVGQLTGLKSWKLAKDNLSAVDILMIIKTKKRFPLAVDWYRINGLDTESLDIHIELLIHAFSELNDYNSLRKMFQSVLESVQLNDVIAIVEKTLSVVESFELQSFLVELLIGFHRKRLNFAMVQVFEQHRMGIEMLKLISKKVRDDYVKLISQPLLLAEQLLMNCEIDSLKRICNHVKTLPLDALLEKYAQKAVQLEIYDASSASGSEIASVSQLLNDNASSRMASMFTVPDKVPSKDQWISDSAESRCMICQVARFSMFNRRHHCRRCGRVVCQSCSGNTFLIPEINATIAVRVCNDCHAFLKQIDRKQSTVTANSGGSTGSEPSFGPLTGMESFNQRRTAWYLYPNEESINESRRQEFAYECSPSVTLCLAILKLHSNKRRCCKFIIDKICAPMLESADSRNVDPTLLIEMIRSLLMSTRISVEAELLHGAPGSSMNTSTASTSPPTTPSRSDLRQNDIEQLNLYLDRLDVIRMLINCNYGTKQMIGFVLNNNVQKIQERLIEIERFELAIDIAKKYGFDSSSIWKTWATICLKNGQLSEARRKFGRFFDQCTRPGDKQTALRTIVDVLVQSQNCLFTQSNQSFTAAALKQSCEQIMAGKFGPPAGGHETPADVKTQLILPEILYYLHNYGGVEECLRFYVKFDYWKEALDVFVTNYAKDSTGTRFLNELFLPAQKRGSLSGLLNAIRTVDPHLNAVWSSLIFVCKHLDRCEHYNCLYRVQLFMSDYLRAAITQIKHFFLSPITQYPEESSSYDELASRAVHLEKARNNCNMFLRNIEHIRSKAGCLHVDRKEVLKQIRLIETQIDVLKRFSLKKVTFPVVGVDRTLSAAFVRFFDRTLFQKEDTDGSPTSTVDDTFDGSPNGLCLKPTAAKSADKDGGHPPTLLEHDASRKSYIAALIILHYDDSIEESFRFSLRIIQEHHLDSDAIYKIAVGLLIAGAIEKGLSNTLIIAWIEQLLHCVRSCNPSNGTNTAVGADDRRLSTDPSSAENDKAGVVPGATTTTSAPSSSLSFTIKSNSRLCDEIVENALNAIKWTLDSVSVSGSNVAGGGAVPLANAVRTQLSELGDNLVKLLSDDQAKIDTYLAAKKLKLAYLLAVSSPKVDTRATVERVAQKARQLGDQTYIKICELWLMKNAALHL